MIECDRCGAEFDDEDDYLRHLGKTHEDDLSYMERKRVGNVTDEPFPWGAAVGGVVIVGVLGAVLYFVMFAGGSTSPGGPSDVAIEPGPRDSDHYHGQIDVWRNGSRVDLSRPEYQVQDARFHMEGGNGERWHAHATDVSLEYGLEALGFPEDRWDVTRVDGEPVDPARYVLDEGDAVNVTVS
jgi:hypothetical protein